MENEHALTSFVIIIKLIGHLVRKDFTLNPPPD